MDTVHISISIAISGDSHKGAQINMSEFTNREAIRLKQALDAKRIRDEKSVQEDRIKRDQGPKFWEETRKHAHDIVGDINQRMDRQLLLWRSERSSEIDIIAPEISQRHTLEARFNASAYRLSWTVPAGKQGQRKMVLFVDNGTLFWNDGSENRTQEEVAEQLIRELTETIS